jgi:hypothetical protein
MRMKENALHPGVLETYITFLMMACDTNDRNMIEAMVKAIVTEYTPQPHSLPSPMPAAESNRPLLMNKTIPYRI